MKIAVICQKKALQPLVAGLFVSLWLLFVVLETAEQAGVQVKYNGKPV